MPRAKKFTEEEDPGGAPEWMVTFSDCMTLLLTFFVLLLSFASFEPEVLPALGMSFAKAMPSIGLSGKDKLESMYKKQDTNDQSKQIDGSEVRTNAVQQTTNFMKEKKPLDFRNLKVFTIESEKFFWGKGRAISEEGKETLDALAKYLKHRTGRIVIGENGPEENVSLGLSRAIATMNYLVNNHNIRKSRFNISAQTTMLAPVRHRQVEIILLDRSVYE